MADDGTPSPTIVLRTRREPDTVLLEVIDNGPAWTKTLNRIFEPFTTKDVGPGRFWIVGVPFHRHRATQRPVVGKLQTRPWRLFQHSPAFEPGGATMSAWVLIVDDEEMIRKT